MVSTGKSALEQLEPFVSLIHGAATVDFPEIDIVNDSGVKRVWEWGNSLGAETFA